VGPSGEIPSQNQGAFAEYVAVLREALAAKPDDVADHVAAAAATVAMTSLRSLRDLGRLGDGGRALIIGAGGGIGSVAIGIDKRLGGDVTGVCSTRDVERIKRLGADAAIEWSQSDPLDAEGAYDVVFDTPAVHSFGRCAKVLRAGGWLSDGLDVPIDSRHRIADLAAALER
jgi:NADPH:quinone reductase-like Zn-dependent oxidoreductase